jgi:photosystem II stability/assembly factor-like uncharacterized protein
MKSLTVVFIIILSVSLSSQQVTEWNRVKSISNVGVYKQGIDNFGNYYAAIDGSTNFGDKANKVQYSSDGGNSWEVILENKHFNIDENFNPLPGDWHARYFNSIALASPNHVYVIGQEDLRTDDNQSLYSFIYKTGNRGETWDRIDICDFKKGFVRNFISMIDSLEGFLYSANCEEGKVRELYYTDDGFESMVAFNLEDEDFKDAIYLEAINKNTIIVGTRSYVLHSTNGGVSWVKNPAPPDVTGYGFVSANVGFATGARSTGLGVQKKGLVYKTTDGGMTWINVMEESDDLAFSGLDAVSFLDEKNGLAVGNMRIYSTDDGGISWVYEEIPFEVYQTPLRSVKYGTEGSSVVYGRDLINTNWDKRLAAPWLNITSVAPYDLDYEVGWNKIEGAVNYEFQLAEYKITSFPSYTPPEKFEDIMVFSVVKEDEYNAEIFDYLKYSKYYYLRVRAMNENDTSQWSRYYSFRTEQKPSDDVLTTPKLISPENASKEQPISNIEFKWFDQPAGLKYDLIIRKELYEPNPDTDKEIKNITKNSFVVGELEKNTTYFWYVIAFDKNNETKNSGYRQFQTTGGTTNVETATQLLKLYPNPADKSLRIESNSLLNSVRIIDLVGVIRYENYMINDKQINIDILDLPSGSYTLIAKTKNGQLTSERIIITK